ncbi:response regulator [Methanosarcina siciliae]|uniref:hypothetical protein n=1 Tax=Methanosarcina siciliae TaxID=38027 RepID=UPI000B18AD3A|nr:hypothetical protein [Methanosarcina siciliae]
MDGNILNLNRAGQYLLPIYIVSKSVPLKEFFIMELVRTLPVSFGYEPVEAMDGYMTIELGKKQVEHYFIRYTVIRDRLG